MSARYRAACERWRDTAGLSHEQLAHQIRDDAIDILVDLNLHMADDRLEVFARKPAPVQVTYLGYPSTTGLQQIDWRITDAHLDPDVENDAYYAEKSFRLPWNFYWRPVHPTPEPNELPARAGGAPITFGCLNNFTKVTQPTVDLWGRVLSELPDSRLLLMTGPGAHRKRLTDRFASHNVNADRIEFVDYMPQYEYLATYHRIDIALDTYPCPGHATTCDALWMGVPVVTLPASTAISRGGVSILRAVNLPEFIADSADDCVRRLVSLAQDRPRLQQLRSELRPRMLASPLMDAARFVRDFEAAYRSMWTQWLQQTASRA
jgi:predicted O-linked N-acetylglucosamine transferase (SPINDLY family)